MKLHIKIIWGLFYCCTLYSVTLFVNPAEDCWELLMQDCKCISIIVLSMRCLDINPVLSNIAALYCHMPVSIFSHSRDVHLLSCWFIVYQLKQKHQPPSPLSSQSIAQIWTTMPNDEMTLSFPADEALAVSSWLATNIVSWLKRSAWDFHQSSNFTFSTTFWWDMSDWNGHASAL